MVPTLLVIVGVEFPDPGEEDPLLCPFPIQVYPFLTTFSWFLIIMTPSITMIALYQLFTFPKRSCCRSTWALQFIPNVLFVIFPTPVVIFEIGSFQDGTHLVQLFPNGTDPFLGYLCFFIHINLHCFSPSCCPRNCFIFASHCCL